MIEGDDDYWGEDSHAMHHLAGSVYYTDLPDHRKQYHETYAKYHAAIFRGLSVAEVAGLMLANQWDKLAEHFVQYNDAPAPNKLPEEELLRRGSENLSAGVQQSVWVGQGLLTQKEVACMLKSRAQRREPKWTRAELLYCDSAKTSWHGEGNEIYTKDQ